MNEKKRSEERDPLDRSTRLELIRAALLRGGASGVNYPTIDVVPINTAPLPSTMRVSVRGSDGTLENKVDVSLDE